MEQTVCKWRTVASPAQVADLVLYLHHEDRLSICILFADVRHEPRERLGIGSDSLVAEGRKNFKRSSFR